MKFGCRLTEHQAVVTAAAAPSGISEASAGGHSQEREPAESERMKRKRIPEGAAKFLDLKLAPQIKKGQRWGTLKDGELVSVLRMQPSATCLASITACITALSQHRCPWGVCIHSNMLLTRLLGWRCSPAPRAPTCM